MLYQSFIFALLVTSAAEWVEISTVNPILYEDQVDMKSEKHLSLQSTFNHAVMAKEMQKEVPGRHNDEEYQQNDYKLIAPGNISKPALERMKLHGVKAPYEKEEYLKNSFQVLSIPTEIFQSVQRSLLLGSSHKVNKKIEFLQGLQNLMLNHIQNMLEQQWNTGRKARFEKGMAFPSMEGTLMSISFLIFAVFLVKLVQQLIQSLQGASVPLTPTMLIAGRRRRSLTASLEAMQALHFIEKHEW